MTTLVLRPERTLTTVLEAVGAAILLVVLFSTRRYVFFAGTIIAAGVVVADLTARVELVREGDAITITWRNVFGMQRQTALSRIGLTLAVRDGDLVLVTSDGELVLGDSVHTVDVRAFVD